MSEPLPSKDTNPSNEKQWRAYALRQAAAMALSHGSPNIARVLNVMADEILPFEYIDTQYLESRNTDKERR